MQTGENRLLAKSAHELKVIRRALASRVASASAEFMFAPRDHVYITIPRHSVPIGTWHRFVKKLKAKIFAHDVCKSISTRHFRDEEIRHLTRKFVDKFVILRRSNAVSAIVHELAEYWVEEDDWNGYQARRTIEQDARILRVLELLLLSGLGSIGRRKGGVFAEVFVPLK
jgi:hypothetical protein